WVNEINVLGVVKHPNLVKLVGYCTEDNETGTQLLLVYEYMPNRSVRDRLSRSSKSLLSWKDRMKVAQDAARGLAYLHEEMDLEIIFRDIKSSNVLLDDQWNAKLLDFGLARLGPQDGRTHVTTTNFTGTIGYAALEFISTGRRSSKSDVWSYGIFLYELITGRHPLHENGPRHEELLEWVNPQLNPKKFITIIDSRLGGKYSFKSAQELSIIANSCLSSDPKSRPKMSEVLEMINQLIGIPTTATMPMEVSAEWDPWAVDDDYECEIVESDAAVPKHVPLHQSGPLPEEFYRTLQAASMAGILETKKNKSATPASSQ
ncbi:serine/threonine-protein kinase PCRK1, partial [Tanacetum coccineum]